MRGSSSTTSDSLRGRRGSPSGIRGSTPGITGWLRACIIVLGAFPSSMLGAPQTPPDSAKLRHQAEAAQGRFERFHRSRLPWAQSAGGGSCDERIGRICLRFEADLSWDPLPEDTAVVAAREELLKTLAEVGSRIPGDRWVMGQRVRYLGDVSRWKEAESVAVQCRGAPGWWCDGLLGYVRYRSGRTVDGLRDFARALAAMDPGDAERWRDPAPLVESPASRWLEGKEGLDPEEATERFWILADPLFLTPGNERLAEHYARRFAFSLFDGSAMTMGIPWGSSLEQLLLRYGFTAGWERSRPAPGDLAEGSVVAHHHPESRGLLPPFEALKAPSLLADGAWTVRDEGPRSASAPVLAPLIVDEAAQIAVLRRGAGFLVVAAYGPPEDELLERRRGGEPSPMEGAGGGGPPGRPLGEPTIRDLASDTLAGLFLLPDSGIATTPLSARSRGGRGVLCLGAPPGGYLLSLELWNPAGRWGARLRRGVRLVAIPPDSPALSDLLLLDDREVPPATFEDAIRFLRPTTRIGRPAVIALAWEVYGLRPIPQDVTFQLRVTREDGGFLRTALEKVGFLHRTPPLTLSWSESLASSAGPVLRTTDVDLSSLDPGQYVLTLVLDLPYRSKAISRKRITVF